MDVYEAIKGLPKPYYDDGGGRVVFHGDCRELLPLLPPESIDLVLTDPPYGICLEEHGRNGHDWTVAGDIDQEVGAEVLRFVERREWPQIVFASPKAPWPGKWRQWLVWDKGPTVGGGGDRATCWKFDWEIIQVRRTGTLNGQRETSVLRYHVSQRDYALHPCQKPERLLRYLIIKSTMEGGVICDPFVGSGSTIRAAKDTNRQAIGIELEERYCEIAANRLSQGVLF